MEIEKKFKDRFVIPKDKKPKLGVATNYIMSDTDFSSTRRQFVVEFGSYYMIKRSSRDLCSRSLWKEIF